MGLGVRHGREIGWLEVSVLRARRETQMYEYEQLMRIGEVKEKGRRG